ncbi:MAG: NB-ARC domain-containing protein [Egibacteraceae bacterium]
MVDLVGRSEDAAWAAVELARARLVTFTGTGGVGKTSLALRVAWETARGYPDGVWWCELAPVTEEGVTDALVAVLGIRPREGVNPTERVVEYLRPQHLLLVLDNCEHVLDEAARLASAIVRGCPRVTVLATSRAPLGLTSERGPRRLPVGGSPFGHRRSRDGGRGAVGRALRRARHRRVPAVPADTWQCRGRERAVQAA